MRNFAARVNGAPGKAKPAEPRSRGDGELLTIIMMAGHIGNSTTVHVNSLIVGWRQVVACRVRSRLRQAGSDEASGRQIRLAVFKISGRSLPLGAEVVQ
jgi:hypothetical protein